VGGARGAVGAIVSAGTGFGGIMGGTGANTGFGCSVGGTLDP